MKAKDQPRAECAATNSVPAMRVVAAFVLLFAACSARSATPRIGFSVVATHPHDASSFTQGLAIVDGALVESSGGYGRSRITVSELRGSRILRERKLPRDTFGEGVASDGSRLVQLTWQSGFALLWDTALKSRGRLGYAGEGWGLAWDGRRWLMSNGTDRIVRRDAVSFAPSGMITVRAGGRPVTRLNELEFANGVLFANVWHSDSIAAVDPDTGAVLGWLDLAALKRGFVKPPGWDGAEHVLNGIAYDPATGHLLVTGKCWPVLYELQLERWPSPGTFPRP